MIFWTSGCILVPLPSRSSGANFSKEALAFLDFPDTTRADVLATLGEPALEIRDPGVLVYLCEVTQRTLVIPMQFDSGSLDRTESQGGNPSPVIGGHSHVEDGPSKEQALFIAYDEHGQVFAHEIRMADPGALDLNCREWRLSKREK